MEIASTLATIRAAVEPDATPEARTAGVTACRTILVALEGGVSPPAAPPALNPAAIASALATLRGIPPDQLLDLAIAKLRASLPAGTQATPTSGFKMPFVPVPPVLKG